MRESAAKIVNSREDYLRVAAVLFFLFHFFFQKTDVMELTEREAVLADGTKEPVDVIFYCTGRVPLLTGAITQERERALVAARVVSTRESR